MTATEAIEAALLGVARNVAKHLIQRDGFSTDDKCFQIDLREAEATLHQHIATAVADACRHQRELDACVARGIALRYVWNYNSTAAAIAEEVADAIAQAKE